MTSQTGAIAVRARPLLKLLVLLSTIMASRAMAVPEMSRFGYFSCNTCHVSASGGGLLTPYGRSLSAERLSAWSRKDEELPLQGAVGISPEWLRLGGDIRYAQIYSESVRRRTGRGFRMQSDLELGVALPRVTIVAAGGPRGETKGRPDLAGKFGWRRYYAKVDVTDSAFIQAGRFYPRYGLMIPQHNANIRRGLGFDQGLENRNIEATWTSETAELSLSRLIGVPKNEGDGSHEKGWTTNVAHYLFDRFRVGLSGLSVEADSESRKAVGLNGVFGIGEHWFLMSEVDRQTRNPKATAAPGREEAMVFTRLGYEPSQGVVPYLAAEVTKTNLQDVKARTDLIGLGLQWYPRPHFDFETQLGAILSHADYTFSTAGYAILHYYL